MYDRTRLGLFRVLNQSSRPSIRQSQSISTYGEDVVLVEQLAIKGYKSSSQNNRRTHCNTIYF